MMEYTPYSPLPAAPRPTPQVERHPVAVGTLGAIIGRLEEAVEAETRAIRTDPAFDIKASNARKSRYLYELNRAMKSQGMLGEEHREGVVRLREKLATNEAAILAHLKAVNEVAELIQGAIQRAETDGTYSSGEFGQAKA